MSQVNSSESSSILTITYPLHTVRDVLQEYQTPQSLMKITPKLIASAPNVINPEGLLTLVLRDQGILFIENLQTYSDVYSVIDLTNNDVTELWGICDQGRIETVLLANNNISSLGPDSLDGTGSDGTNEPECNEQQKNTTNTTTTGNTTNTTKTGKKFSSLKSLLLINNNVSAFTELVKLQRFHNLQSLYMIGNPISEKHHYRAFLVWILPQLRILDGEKVKPRDREAATELFGATLTERTPAADALLHQKAQESSIPKQERLMENAVKKLSAEDKEKLISDLDKALTMEEIERISIALKNGYVE